MAGRAVELYGLIDDSAGYHARRTDWRWCAGVGVGGSGAALCFNIVDGVHDAPRESERTVWVDGAASELPPATFADDLSAVTFPADPAARLAFAEEARRARSDDFKLMASDYVQPFGTFSGTLPGGVDRRPRLGRDGAPLRALVTAVRRALHAWAGGLPRTFWSLWAGTLVNRIGTFVEPFLALYLTQARDLSAGRAGVVVALVGGGSVISQPLGGALTDRVGRRPTLVGGMVASGLAIAALGFARSLWAIALCTLLVGIVGDLYRPASQATIADVVAIEDRRRASGLLFWAVNLGFSVAALGGGLLAAHGYGLLFALDAITCCGYALVVWRTIPETRPPEAAQHRAAAGRATASCCATGWPSRSAGSTSR